MRTNIFNYKRPRGVGKTRRKLAELLCQLTGALVEPEDIKMTNPRERYYRDNCAWDCWGTLPAKDGVPARRVHLYSWDPMGACVKNGIYQVTKDYMSSGGISPSDFEISAKG